MSNENPKVTEGPSGWGGSCCSGAGKWIWIILAVAILAVLIAKSPDRCGCGGSSLAPQATATGGTAKVETAPASAAQGQALPRLVDLGATQCIPCKMMAPILEDLKKTYAGKLKVQFIDVWKNPDEARKYGIRVIPTQIFFDADGKELFRHEGFFSKEDILTKWKELGVELQRSAISDQI